MAKKPTAADGSWQVNVSVKKSSADKFQVFPSNIILHTDAFKFALQVN